MKIKDGFVLRKIANEWVAIPTGSRTAEFSGLISLNDTGKFLWELLANDKSKNELVTALADEYEVDALTATADVNEYLEYLMQKKLVSE